MYASAHVPHYKQRVGAIEKLLTCKGEVRWTVECAQTLHDLLKCVQSRVQLVSANPHGVLLLYPSVIEGFGFVACLQDQTEGDQPVVFVSRKLTHTEEKAGWLT